MRSITIKHLPLLVVDSLSSLVKTPDVDVPTGIARTPLNILMEQKEINRIPHLFANSAMLEYITTAVLLKD